MLQLIFLFGGFIAQAHSSLQIEIGKEKNHTRLITFKDQNKKNQTNYSAHQNNSDEELFEIDLDEEEEDEIHRKESLYKFDICATQALFLKHNLNFSQRIDLLYTSHQTTFSLTKIYIANAVFRL